jgi:hypothetical protein
MQTTPNPNRSTSPRPSRFTCSRTREGARKRSLMEPSARQIRRARSPAVRTRPPTATEGVYSCGRQRPRGKSGKTAPKLVSGCSGAFVRCSFHVSLRLGRIASSGFPSRDTSHVGTLRLENLNKLFKVLLVRTLEAPSALACVGIKGWGASSAPRNDLPGPRFALSGEPTRCFSRDAGDARLAL